ncbi:MAG: Wzt carbohydrate-binding domain-containing protein [Candidatus Omnitrophota bacterium]|nr:Wzt carbohydrate-binding domain-containing protein [Candidatus Omnitrophota bacterium]
MITCPTETKQPDTQQKAVELAGVGKKYPLPGKLADFWALKGLSLTVGAGEVLGIIGRNGAGKTTLLNLIAGTLSPTEGELLAKGRVLGLFNLGVGFQDELSGRENIFLNAAILGASRKETEGKFSAITEFSELGDFIRMPLGSYSQGMRLRLAFSIVANLDFDILVIDEILAVGDALFQSKCFERLMDFRRANKTLIITTQGMELIERLCDKVVLLDHGRNIFFGLPADGINKYRQLLNTERFFVGQVRENASLIEHTKRWADDIGGWGRALGTKQARIESVELQDARGRQVNQIESGYPLKVKINFTVREEIRDPHFGVAIFRNDGVYCYGPNTFFDGYTFPLLKQGGGSCALFINKLVLAPGDYFVSVAIWDKEETLPYDYREGYYNLKVAGRKTDGELLQIPYHSIPRGWLPLLHSIRARPDNEVLLKAAEAERAQIHASGIKLERVMLTGADSRQREIFMTNEPVKFHIHFVSCNGRINHKGLFIFLGIYRDDGVCCQLISEKLPRAGIREVIFKQLPLLPGGYKISAGLWDARRKKFIVLHNQEYGFRKVFNRKDHGTVYLTHEWNLR